MIEIEYIHETIIFGDSEPRDGHDHFTTRTERKSIYSMKGAVIPTHVDEIIFASPDFEETANRWVVVSTRMFHWFDTTEGTFRQVAHVYVSLA